VRAIDDEGAPEPPGPLFCAARAPSAAPLSPRTRPALRSNLLLPTKLARLPSSPPATALRTPDLRRPFPRLPEETRGRHPTQKMRAGRKMLTHTLTFLSGASGDQGCASRCSPRRDRPPAQARSSAASARVRPPQSPRTSSQVARWEVDAHPYPNFSVRCIWRRGVSGEVLSPPPAPALPAHHARAPVAPACARPSRRAPAHKLRAGTPAWPSRA